jgi:cytochrome b6
LNCPRLRDWLEERYDLEGIKGIARGKFVPEHRHDIWYYTGGITLFLFLLQFLTGMLMAFYYVPHVDFAYKSIIEIVTKLRMGWFFKSLHHWGAQMAILFLFVHLFGTLLMKSYRKPRELVWVTGFVLLGISIFFGLSGYLLLWDERAFAAVRCHGRGRRLSRRRGVHQGLPQGEYRRDGETLLRFYAFPRGDPAAGYPGPVRPAPPARPVPRDECPALHGKGEAPGGPLLSERLLQRPDDLAGRPGSGRDAGGFLPPRDRREGRSPGPPPENIKPEWYFLFLLQTLKLFPGSILGMNGETIAILTVSGRSSSSS